MTDSLPVSTILVPLPLSPPTKESRRIFQPASGSKGVHKGVGSLAKAVEWSIRWERWRRRVLEFDVPNSTLSGDAGDALVFCQQLHGHLKNGQEQIAVKHGTSKT